MEMKDDNPDKGEQNKHPASAEHAFPLNKVVHEPSHPVSIKNYTPLHTHGSTDSTGMHSAGGFSVHTGPVNLSRPVGLSSPASHYIEPRPPTYITEYERSYTWPHPSDTDLHRSSTFAHTESRSSPLKAHDDQKWNISNEMIHDQLAAEGHKHKKLSWDTMECALTQLSKMGYERTLVDGVLPQISKRKLDPSIEYAYGHLKDRLQSFPAAIFPAATASEQQQEQFRVWAMCKEFVDSCDAVRDAHDFKA